MSRDRTVGALSTPSKKPSKKALLHKVRLVLTLAHIDRSPKSSQAEKERKKLEALKQTPEGKVGIPYGCLSRVAEREGEATGYNEEITASSLPRQIASRALSVITSLCIQRCPHPLICFVASPQSKADKATWDRLAQLAAGTKLHDDPALLRKSIRREQQRKRKSAKEWSASRAPLLVLLGSHLACQPSELQSCAKVMQHHIIGCNSPPDQLRMGCVGHARSCCFAALLISG